MVRRNSATEKARREVELKQKIAWRKHHHEVYNLEGKNKILYDIGELERHIRNVKYDIEMQGEHLAFTSKLSALNSQLENLKTQLKQLEQEVKV